MLLVCHHKENFNNSSCHVYECNYNQSLHLHFLAEKPSNFQWWLLEQVSISSTFYARFFADIPLSKCLKAECFSFVIFGTKFLYEKRARKTLMTLTAGWLASGLLCSAFWYNLSVELCLEQKTLAFRVAVDKLVEESRSKLLC